MRCMQPLIEILSVALDRRSANWRNLCIIELADSGNGSGMSDRMRVTVRSFLTGVIMLVFILPFDHFGLLRSHVFSYHSWHVRLPPLASLLGASSNG
jgi:hypothetical protein